MDLTTTLAALLVPSALGLGAILILGLIAAAVLTVVGLALTLLFFKTRKIIVPDITLFVLNVVESPIRYLLWKAGIEEDIVSNMMIDVRNIRYREQYIMTPYEARMIFIPQCLRHPQCPAPLTADGINCLNCGRCGIGRVKEEGEQLGTRIFIAPGSSLVKRMVKKHKPRAVLGIGCGMEVKEGTEVMAAYGIIVQGLKLHKDGCVNTRTDVIKLIELIKNPPGDTHYSLKDHPAEYDAAVKIAQMWADSGEQAQIMKTRKH